MTEPSVTADFRFENSLLDSVGPGSELGPIFRNTSRFAVEEVLGRTRPVLEFEQGGGLALADASDVIGSEYTIELVLRFDRLDGYVKIIDFKDATTDCGLYSFDGRMNFFPIDRGPAAAMNADSYAHVVLTRDAAEIVVAYVDGVRQLSFHDTGAVAVVGASDTLVLFSDDASTSGEESGGAVSRIRLYDGPLAASEIARLAAEPPSTVFGDPGNDPAL